MRPSLLFGAVFVLIPILQYFFFTLIFIPLFQGQDEARIRKAGILTKGEVVRVEDVPNLSINGIAPKRVFFRYRVDGAEREGSTVTVSVAEVAKWQKGRPVDVRYLDRQATIVEVEPVEFPLSGPAIWTAWSAGLAVGVAFLAFGLFRARRMYQLLKYGVVRPAKLVSCETVGLGLFPWPRLAPRFNAAYVYADLLGREMAGSATSADLLLLNRQKGEEVPVLVLPQRRAAIDDSRRRGRTRLGSSTMNVLAGTLPFTARAALSSSSPARSRLRCRVGAGLGANAAITADGGKTWTRSDRPFAYRSGVAWAKDCWTARITTASRSRQRARVGLLDHAAGLRSSRSGNPQRIVLARPVEAEDSRAGRVIPDVSVVCRLACARVKT